LRLIDDLALVSCWLTVALIAYTYLGYPLLLAVLALWKPTSIREQMDAAWPLVTLLVPVHNEELAIRHKLDNLLRLEYPKTHVRILVLSDASTDGTNAVVESYTDARIKLLKLEQRVGKTEAQNHALPHVRGDVVVNTDVAVRLEPSSLEALVRPFLDDARIGVVSGRLIGLHDRVAGTAREESWYLRYEMMIRVLESRTGSTVGAAGGFYGVRRELFGHFPAHLSRDFGSVLLARKRGYRAIVAPEAQCYVAGTGSLVAEYRRKVRTMTRGLQTLLHHVELANPLRFGLFSIKLLSHKLARWAVPPLLPIALAGGLWLAARSGYAVIAVSILVILSGALLAGLLAGRRHVRPLLSRLGYVVLANLAAIEAWVNLLRGDTTPIWAPTRRQPN